MICHLTRNYARQEEISQIKYGMPSGSLKGWEIDEDKAQPQSSALAVEWMESRTNAALKDLESQYGEFRLSEALMTTYRLVWEEFCSWYLELVKPPYGESIDRKTLDATFVHFETYWSKLCILLCPS